ncbi:MAG TPA: bifunctional oligoribonuclease/PAP phosphatase NrnA [Thermoanaerobaculia bacterium]|nr:bifunctional oligoribonuclease/PAP phosphatase NrnA [Thermoanaerobaculia bacterium]
MNDQQTPLDLSAARQVAERIRAGKRFLITSHRNPDGDALGSSLALQRLLRRLGKEANVIVRDPFGKPLRKIPGAEDVAVVDSLPADYPEGYDAIFTMECPEHERTGFPILPGPVINIDHHLGNTMYGEVNYLDLDAPSVGEMILQISRLLELPLDRETAIAMYVSLATDTGFFRYSNTTLRAFQAAEELVRAGADPGEISLWINESSSAASIRLLGLCLATMEFFADGRIATIEMPRRFLRDAGASGEDAEGIVNYGRVIEGVLVAAMFKEVEGGTRVSMRAKPGVDVQAVASMFGGGGHKAASGCFIAFPIADAKPKLVGILTEAIAGVEAIA